MKTTTEKLSAELSTAVNSSNVASAAGSGYLEVFATPMMIALMEGATCKVCEPILDEGETSVGTKISVSHDKAIPIGETVTAFAELAETDGRRLVFSVYAKDGKGDIVGKGTVERFVVLTEKFMKRVNGI
ncbi:MAG: thioesterase family protein [Clostridiales bacterium]|nr:thioesterase family protein [Clostridiales bacterium]